MEEEPRIEYQSNEADSYSQNRKIVNNKDSNDNGTCPAGEDSKKKRDIPVNRELQKQRHESREL